MNEGIRLVSDGTVAGTRVYTKDGEDITKKLHIRGIRWQHNAGGIPSATLDCTLAAIEADIPPEDIEIVREVTDLSDEYREYRKN